ncbi:hypothetical protein I7I53_09699 [Histoplasma capsulatum var. duboisii H88]|uniref:Uncharacterized protein n=1 Tax=Ajellomyces capsulatus (strain H88) TaxID=544711 RepID=A0A8A1LBG5_AJEC8|nr:hypothetical protein I7I53_09699 [Histoplasma capsulatum var. duboisii H88]
MRININLSFYDPSNIVSSHPPWFTRSCCTRLFTELSSFPRASAHCSSTIVTLSFRSAVNRLSSSSLDSVISRCTLSAGSPDIMRCTSITLQFAFMRLLLTSCKRQRRLVWDSMN